MKRNKFVITVILSFSLSMQAQNIILPDTNKFCFFPMHKSCVRKIVSYEHQQLGHDFSVNVVCYFNKIINIKK